MDEDLRRLSLNKSNSQEMQRPQEGSAVVYTDSFLQRNTDSKHDLSDLVGVLLQDDRSDRPFQVRFSNGETRWVEEGNIMTIAHPGDKVFSHNARRGMRVLRGPDWKSLPVFADSIDNTTLLYNVCEELLYCGHYRPEASKTNGTISHPGIITAVNEPNTCVVTWANETTSTHSLKEARCAELVFAPDIVGRFDSASAVDAVISSGNIVLPVSDSIPKLIFHTPLRASNVATGGLWGKLQPGLVRRVLRNIYCEIVLSDQTHLICLCKDVRKLPAAGTIVTSANLTVGLRVRLNQNARRDEGIVTPQDIGVIVDGIKGLKGCCVVAWESTKVNYPYIHRIGEANVFELKYADPPLDNPEFPPASDLFCKGDIVTYNTRKAKNTPRSANMPNDHDIFYIVDPQYSKPNVLAWVQGKQVEIEKTSISPICLILLDAQNSGQNTAVVEVQYWTDKAPPKSVGKAGIGYIQSTIQNYVQVRWPDQSISTHQLNSKECRLFVAPVHKNVFSIGSKVKISPDYKSLPHASRGFLSEVDVGTVSAVDSEELLCFVESPEGILWWYEFEALIICQENLHP
eukprot:TRINITY_DN679_c0_g1_i1.p1 TRINITY_DN679_c0_g1~~TRINITY_DN679_c0_g1_i1.p1  ORF type:complete len:572 (+),score=76.25 TRINITY_DN679_c0_g1_i1:1710-3425(+)